MVNNLEGNAGHGWRRLASALCMGSQEIVIATDTSNLDKTKCECLEQGGPERVYE